MHVATGGLRHSAGLAGPDERAAWRAYLRGHARVTRALEAELVAEQRLSLAA